MDSFAGGYPPVPLNQYWFFFVRSTFFKKITVLLCSGWLRIKKTTNYINGDEHVTIAQDSLVSLGNLFTLTKGLLYDSAIYIVSVLYYWFAWLLTNGKIRAVKIIPRIAQLSCQSSERCKSFTLFYCKTAKVPISQLPHVAFASICLNIAKFSIFLGAQCPLGRLFRFLYRSLSKTWI